MVANITTGSNIFGAVFYNQQKVEKGEATVISTQMILDRGGGFDTSQVASDLGRWMPLDYRTEKPVIHISLNPDPKDDLSDNQLADIAGQYMERMGYGDQPYIVYKHTDIERTHIHIVSVQVRPDGRKIKDSKRNERSVAVTEELEKQYNLRPAKGQKRGELWQLAPVDHTKGELKKQIAAVIKPAVALYRFQTMGEFRALLSLYNIGMEEVTGERKGKPYHGVIYTALDDKGQKTETTPLKSSLFGDGVGFPALEKRMGRSGEKLAKDKSHEHTRHRVAEAMLDAPTEGELRERLRAYHIDLYLRRNDTGRITGVTFIDHENRCVLNGSRLGKEFSANAINARFEMKQTATADPAGIKKKDHLPKLTPASGHRQKEGKKRGR